jgi:uncharacterized membrane protein YoaK (UPF0700 family)
MWTIPFPDWAHPWQAVLPVLCIVVLDFAGTILAKEAVTRQSPVLAVAGAVTFVALFWVLASALTVTDMWFVTILWIVSIQVMVMVVDAAWYGTVIHPGQVAAVGVALVALSAAAAPVWETAGGGG